MKFVSLILLLRPGQWLKNLLLFFPPFLSGAIVHPGLLGKGIVPLLAFCCASSAGYIVNDLHDRDRDALHPVKARRPIPSGAVGASAASALAASLLAGSLLLSLRVSWLFLGYVALYLLISAAYSMFLKDEPIFDIFCISSGFVLRLYGGGAAFGVVISDWLFLTVFLLSIFLSVGKRFSERRTLGGDAVHHRRALGRYPDGFLESAMYLSGAAVLVTYSMYVISKPLLVYSVPLCLFGLLRYLFRVKSGEEGDPTNSLLKDPLLLLIGIAWMLFIFVCVYL